MSLAPIPVPDRQASPSITLGSNNPFRNRAASPSTPNSLVSPGLRPQRPLSTNPFLDETESFSPSSLPSSGMADASDLFENLSLEDRKRRPPPRPENIPPLSSSSLNAGRPLPQHRRPSNHEASRSRSTKTGQLIDVFADPSESTLVGSSTTVSHSSSAARPERRPRRNSDSSLMERPKLLDPEEDRRRRERRHREREARHRDGKSSRSRRGNNYKLDIIDKLDVTGIYGPGSFHHDGPFDACNPHRNRKGSRAAPMQAFPKDSRNMAIGGAGPNNNKLDLNQIHGRGQEGYSDFSTGISGGSGISSSSMKADAAVAFNPTSQIEQVHSDISMGLGTSTFLEGTPASRAAIQRKESESDTMQAGLQRKKSLAQKIRGINNRSISSGRVMSPEPLLHRRPSEAADNPPRYAPPPPPPRATSSRRANTNDKNPFFSNNNNTTSNNNAYGSSSQDYDDAYDMKSAKIQNHRLVDSDDGYGGRPRAMSSPRGRPERKESSDGMTSPTAEDPKPSGFISRVKSLRKPRAR
ncbi:hypothetical protein TMEN_6307 [Trichophyton mentagrophytes]|nr:Pal1 cell morphology protein, variant 2 [Trichophyton interdigitale]KAG5218339.1 Pal1 cell morphology protein, variant 2 [Trichophyton interdigitale]KAG8205221.1 Pal1 cell morphology protein, variant 2 [Trichophyton interdigitale]GBF63665.1 hypothetical protein TMEN_6307 [Trichophyton mentagrophytes]